ncbi:hypothetical protein BJX61DRAFT_301142 [Aspergillus egyptiacus]|nr:hypothetical protein BJX61DRAFT_301142 [Aspergillus egyptiacus]
MAFFHSQGSPNRLRPRQTRIPICIYVRFQLGRLVLVGKKARRVRGQFGGRAGWVLDGTPRFLMVRILEAIRIITSNPGEALRWRLRDCAAVSWFSFVRMPVGRYSDMVGQVLGIGELLQAKEVIIYEDGSLGRFVRKMHSEDRVYHTRPPIKYYRRDEGNGQKTSHIHHQTTIYLSSLRVCSPPSMHPLATGRRKRVFGNWRAWDLLSARLKILQQARIERARSCTHICLV